MNRRAFFSAFTAIAATAALDPERLLWVPGRKLISIPAPPRLMTVQEMLDAALVRLGYFRPLQPGQMTEVFLTMTAMVDEGRFQPTPWHPSIEVVPDSHACRAYVDCCIAVREAVSMQSRGLSAL